MTKVTVPSTLGPETASARQIRVSAKNPGTGNPVFATITITVEPGPPGPEGQNDVAEIVVLNRSADVALGPSNIATVFRGDVLELTAMSVEFIQLPDPVFWNLGASRSLDLREGALNRSVIKVVVRDDAAPTVGVSASTVRENAKLVSPVFVDLNVRDPSAVKPPSHTLASCDSSTERVIKRSVTKAVSAADLARARLLSDPGRAHGILEDRRLRRQFDGVFLAGLKRDLRRGAITHQDVARVIVEVIDGLAAARNALLRAQLTFECDKAPSCCGGNPDDTKMVGGCVDPGKSNTITLCNSFITGTFGVSPSVTILHEAAHLGQVIAPGNERYVGAGWRSTALFDRPDMADAIAVFGIRAGRR